MSTPIYEDEVIVDKDGTVRLKKDGTVLEKNGVWLARNHYLTTREAEKRHQEAMHQAEEERLNKAAKKEALNMGSTKIKQNWWSKLKTMISSRQETK